MAKKPLIDISPENLRVVRNILERHLPTREVRAFGSRVSWTAKEFSDLDLAIMGDTPVPLSTLADLKEELSESIIPFKVDIVDWATTKENFRRIIEKDFVVVQEGKKKSGAGEWVELPFTEAVVINPKVALKKGETFPFVDMSAVNPAWHSVSESEFRIYSGGGAKFEPYDTLMARITPCLENGKIARYVPSSGNRGPAFGSTEFIVIRGREGVTDNCYAYYLSQWQDFRQYAISQMTGSSGRQRVPVDSFSKFHVSVPSLEEQKAIAYVLGTLDDKIELNRKMNETLETMARALFKSWFVDFDPVHAKTDLPAGRQEAAPSSRPGVWFVYALECEGGSIYIGHTEDVQRRFDEHCSGKGAAWTKTHRPNRIAYWEELPSQEAAVLREKKLKTGAGREWLKAEICKQDLLPNGLPKEIASLFPDSFEPSPLGPIPKGWAVKRIDDIAQRVGMGPFGSSIKVETFVPSGVPVISGQHLRGFMVEDNTFNFVSDDHAKRLKSAIVGRGDVVFTHAGNIGQVAYIPESSRYERYVISQRQFFMRCDLGQVAPSFIAFYFKSDEGQHRLLANKSSSGVPSIARPVTYLRSIQLTIPTFPIMELFENLIQPLLLRFRQNLNENSILVSQRDSLLPKLLSGELRIPVLNQLKEKMA